MKDIRPAGFRSAERACGVPARGAWCFEAHDWAEPIPLSRARPRVEPPARIMPVPWHGPPMMPGSGHTAIAADRTRAVLSREGESRLPSPAPSHTSTRSAWRLARRAAAFLMAGFVLTIATAWGCRFLSWNYGSGRWRITTGVAPAIGGTWGLHSHVDRYWCREVGRKLVPWPAAETFDGGVRPPSFETEELARRIAEVKHFVNENHFPHAFSDSPWFWGDMLDPDNTKFDDRMVFRYGLPFSALESHSRPFSTYKIFEPTEPLGLTVAVLRQRNGSTLTLPIRPTRGLLLDTLFWGALCFAVVRTPGAVRRFRRRARGVCEHCGYAITGLASSTCPECGSPTTRNLRPASP